ncbi:hypothetical protein NZK35_32945 [Stieleria sp. ICT_E10.1]|uniref:hypothetical protein n=1 Tax=Stieleria sedimenti TaxID=2976331 RepID=UPI002180049F|nr:hypothetical protein [Stieleria sedimenti]MCS7471481.1 hypothetical protein [Stieleria sedimenti]
MRHDCSADRHWRSLVCIGVAAIFAVPTAANEFELAEPKRPSTITQLIDDWFWPDPYSHLGHVRSNGAGWELLRIAADIKAGSDAGLSSEQISAIAAIYRLTTATTPKGSLADRQQHWHRAELETRKLLSEPQQHRLDQLVIQRRGYRAFLDSDLVTRIELSNDQMTRIRDAIAEHAKRIAENTRTLTAESDRADDEYPRLSEQDRSHLEKARREKVQLGWLSHQKTWNEIREILSPEQVKLFQKLRGARPGNPNANPTAAAPGSTENVPQTPSVTHDPPASQLVHPNRVRTAEEHAALEAIKQQLHDRLLEDLNAPENRSPGSVMRTSYGDGPPAEGSPQALFRAMVPSTYREYIRRHPKLHQLEFDRDATVFVSDETFAVLDKALPVSLDAAIDLMLKAPARPARLAAELIRQRRTKLSMEQWIRIVKGYEFMPAIRKEYPIGVPVDIWGNGAIPFGFLLFDDPTIAGVVTETRSQLDGRPVATMPGSGWRSNLPGVSLGEESLGDHTIEYQLDYTLTVGEQTITGQLISGKIPLTIVPAQPDTLAAAMSDQLREIVTSGIRALPIARGRERVYSRPAGAGAFERVAKLRIPYLDLKRPLPVGLAMEVDVYFADSDQPHSRPVWVVPAGETGRYEVESMVGDARLVQTLSEQADEEGMVDARVVLTPSRSAALSHALLNSYYPESLEVQAQWQLLSVESDQR